MKGIVFNLLEEIVRAEYGEQTWDSLLDSAGLSGAYTSLGSYADEDLGNLVAAASSALGLQPQEVVHWFGRKALPLLAERYPQFFEPHTTVRSFLLTLNDIIHPEVRKLYPGADVPSFDFDASDPAVLVMGYHSKRRLCAFGLGLIEGAAELYGDRLAIDHPSCMLRGDAACSFRIETAAVEEAA